MNTWFRLTNKTWIEIWELGEEILDRHQPTSPRWTILYHKKWKKKSFFSEECREIRKHQGHINPKNNTFLCYWQSVWKVQRIRGWTKQKKQEKWKRAGVDDWTPPPNGHRRPHIFCLILFPSFYDSFFFPCHSGIIIEQFAVGLDLRPASAHALPLYQEGIQGGMEFFCPSERRRNRRPRL